MRGCGWLIYDMDRADFASKDTPQVSIVGEWKMILLKGFLNLVPYRQGLSVVGRLIGWDFGAGAEETGAKK